MLGARRLLARLMLAPLIGALILWLSDQLIQWLARVWMEVSTGSMTALIGTPLLLWLLPRLRSMSAPSMDVGDNVPTERQNVHWFALAGLAVLLLGILVALSFGRDAQGWRWISGTMLDDLMQWRLPRIIAALTAGIMLAVAGCIIQRLTGHPMASPEVLGISSERPSVSWSCCSSCRGCVWLADASRQFWRGYYADYHSDCRRSWGFRHTVCYWPGWRLVPRSLCC